MKVEKPSASVLMGPNYGRHSTMGGTYSMMGGVAYGSMGETAPEVLGVPVPPAPSQYGRGHDAARAAIVARVEALNAARSAALDRKYQVALGLFNNIASRHPNTREGHVSRLAIEEISQGLASGKLIEGSAAPEALGVPVPPPTAPEVLGVPVPPPPPTAGPGGPPPTPEQLEPQAPSAAQQKAAAARRRASEQAAQKKADAARRQEALSRLNVGTGKLLGIQDARNAVAANNLPLAYSILSSMIAAYPGLNAAKLAKKELDYIMGRRRAEIDAQAAPNMHGGDTYSSMHGMSYGIMGDSGPETLGIRTQGNLSPVVSVTPYQKVFDHSPPGAVEKLKWGIGEARKAVRARNFDLALKILKDIMEAFPGSKQARLAEVEYQHIKALMHKSEISGDARKALVVARAALRDRKYQVALGLLDNIANIYPNTPEGRYSRNVIAKVSHGLASGKLVEGSVLIERQDARYKAKEQYAKARSESAAIAADRGKAVHAAKLAIKGKRYQVALTLLENIANIYPNTHEERFARKEIQRILRGLANRTLIEGAR